MCDVERAREWTTASTGEVLDNARKMSTGDARALAAKALALALEEKKRRKENGGGSWNDLVNEEFRANEYAFDAYGSWREMDVETRDWCFELTRANMRELYEQTWGWNAMEKRRELNDAGARFIIARSASTKKPVAFVHFRFEKEDDDVDAPVGYIYELQCEAAHQRRSLGEILVVLVERLSKVLGMHAVVLTVLKANASAYGFYTNKMKYEIDENSPGGDCQYLILSKRFTA